MANMSYELNMKYNFETTKMLIPIVEKHKTRFIFASSASVYGDEGLENLDEYYPVNPKTNYAVSKFKSEEEIRKSKIRAVILRMGTLGGKSPRMRLDLVVNTMCKNAIVNGTIILNGGGENWRPIADVSDMADVYREIILSSEPTYYRYALERLKMSRRDIGTYNVFQKNVRISELGLRISKILGASIDARYDCRDIRDYKLSKMKFDAVFGNDKFFKTDLSTTVSQVRDCVRSMLRLNLCLESKNYHNILWMKEEMKVRSLG
jgi:nucleoside-diphosphate-sugar epimerase